MVAGLTTGFTRTDIAFLVASIDPRLVSRIETIEGDPSLVDGMLEREADRVFERIMSAGQETMARLTPRFLFEILLRRACHDLERHSYTMERSARQRIPVFDSADVVSLLSDRDVLRYLADMLASFTRIESFAIPVRVRKGVWHKIRFNDMDVDSLIKLSETVDEGRRFRFHKRIADCCLFILGMFPEYVTSDLHHSPSGEKRRLPLRRMRRSTEDYEEEGRYFYGLAGEHQDAGVLELSGVLGRLHEKFTLARKPLNYISENYLQLHKQRLFPSLTPN